MGMLQRTTGNISKMEARKKDPYIEEALDRWFHIVTG
jgi:hypothetical protein